LGTRRAAHARVFGTRFVKKVTRIKTAASA